MQEIPFSVSRILEYGATVHRNSTVTTYFGKTADTATFATIASRASALANTLSQDFDIHVGDTVATFLSNCNEHLETMLGAMAMGAVFHPINRLLTFDQITFIINHAEDRVVVCDPKYAEALVEHLPDCPTVEALIVIGPDLSDANLLRSRLDALGMSHVRVANYEAALDGKSTAYDWPALDETAPAAICYSTGTTGDPKGVVYSHRSLWLHSLQLRTADNLGVRNGESFLCCVPIYHVLSWGVPLAAFMCGAPLVFTGRTASAEHLAYVIESAMPRKAHGAPIVWINLLQYYAVNAPKRMSLQEIYSGGSPVPPALIEVWEEQYGVDMTHLWGMTETGPVGTVAHPPAGVSGEARARYRESQGRFSIGVEYRLVDDAGNVIEAHDRTAGELQVRGNTVTGAYYNKARPERFTHDGWFATGDIATVTMDGFLTIHDRKNDLIRSGGEWIYSVALENYLMEVDWVVEAAVIGIEDAKWGQRPLAVIHAELHHDEKLTGFSERALAEILADHVARRVPQWMVPEYFTFTNTVQKTSVGKYDKKALRKAFAEGQFEVTQLRTS